SGYVLRSARRCGLRWNEDKTADAGRTINSEMPLVESENPRDLFPFGDSHQRCVRKVHRQVPILTHERLQPGRIVMVEHSEADTLHFDHFPQRALTFPREREQVHRLRERRPHGEKWITDCLQRSDAFPMVRVATIHDGYERSCI